MPEPLRPHEPRKGRDAAEDAELLKLVGAALDSTRDKQRKRRLGLFGRLRKLRVDMDRAVQKHPFVATGILLASATLIYLLGVTITSLREEAKRHGVANASGGGGPASYGSSGGSSGPSTGSAGAGAGPGGSGSVQNPELAGEDFVKELIARIVAGDYEYRSDVATGRFLRDFHSQRMIIVHVNRELLRPARRGKEWVQVRGPYAAAKDSKPELTRSAQRFRQPSEALVRVVKEEDGWKLEHVRVY